MDSVLGRYALKCDHIFAIYGSDMTFQSGSKIDVLDSTEDSVLLSFGNVHPCGGWDAWHSRDVLNLFERV